jgi:hypothetical protein
VLRQFDLTRGGWGSVELNTLNLPEGSYPIRATLSYLDLAENRIVEVSASNSLSVDRILPVGRVTYPGGAMKLCPSRISDSTGAWYAIPVEGVAKDNSKVEIQYYEVYYGVGENPSIWVPATTKKRGELLPFIEKGRSVQGELGLWDITGIKGEIFSLKLKVVDAAGNVSCDTTTFSFDSLIEIPQLVTDKPLFSPNGDNFLDDIEISYEIDEYAIVDVKIFRLIKESDGSYILDSKPVRNASVRFTTPWWNRTGHMGWQG